MSFQKIPRKLQTCLTGNACTSAKTRRQAAASSGSDHRFHRGYANSGSDAPPAQLGCIAGRTIRLLVSLWDTSRGSPFSERLQQQASPRPAIRTLTERADVLERLLGPAPRMSER